MLTHQLNNELKKIEERITRLEQLIPQLLIPLEKDISKCQVCGIQWNERVCYYPNYPTVVTC